MSKQEKNDLFWNICDDYDNGYMTKEEVLEKLLKVNYGHKQSAIEDYLLICGG